MLKPALADDFHLSRGWYDPWRAAYLAPGATAPTIGGLPVIDERARLGPLGYLHRRSQTNVHSPRLDLHIDHPLDDDLPALLLAGDPDMVTLEYVPVASRLHAAAQRWRAGGQCVTILPQAQAPAADCRAPYAAWLQSRSKRIRTRMPKLEKKLTQGLGMTLELHDGRGTRTALDALIHDCLRVEQSGWKGRERSAILDNPADTAFYTALAHEAAAAGALRIVLLRHAGRIAAFEYGVIGGDRLFLLKVGYDEAFDHLSIGHVLAMMNIRYACEDPRIAWYDKLGNGLTPAAYKLRFADDVDMLYRITLFGDGWRARILRAHQLARHRAKTLRDRWRKHEAAVA